MYTLVIKNMGYVVSGTCTNSEAALDSIRQCVPHLILLDVSLKHNESGIELCKTIRQNHQMPVIFTTGNTNHELKTAIESISNTCILYKPVDNAIIIKTINQLLNKTTIG